MAEPRTLRSNPGAVAYPPLIKPLVGLRFVALAWVILNQFRFHLNLHVGDRSGLVFKGYLGAAMFFVLTGFLAAQAYEAARQQGRFRHGPFLWDKLIQRYPLHLAMIGVFAIFMLAGHAAGAALPAGVFDARGLVANLSLVQAWGTVPTVSWNFPSWLISAEWFAYIALPVTCWMALRRLNPAAMAVAAVMLFVLMFEIADARHVLFTDMTAQIGALQTVPAFLLGAALFGIGRRYALPHGWAGPLAAFAGLWIVAASLLRLSDLVIWPMFGLLVFALAETARTARPALAWPWLQYLGGAAISLYLVYLPVDILYFHAAQRIVGAPTGAVAWAIWAGVFPVILGAGLAAYHLITRPAAAWLSAHGVFRRATPALGAA